MRTIIITDTQGTEVGSIAENEDGSLTGEGKGVTLLEQAPGKTYQEWIDQGHHSKYLRYEEAA